MSKSPKFSVSEMETIIGDAFEKGREEGFAITPTPMNVVQRENPFDDSSRVVKRYPTVTEGACGFAWVIVKPGNSRFANYLKKNGIARPNIYGGVYIWIGDFNQSVERKAAMAYAMAKVFRDNGIKAYSMSRMD